MHFLPALQQQQQLHPFLPLHPQLFGGQRQQQQPTLLPIQQQLFQNKMIQQNNFPKISSTCPNDFQFNNLTSNAQQNLMFNESLLFAMREQRNQLFPVAAVPMNQIKQETIVQLPSLKSTKVVIPIFNPIKIENRLLTTSNLQSISNDSSRQISSPPSSINQEKQPSFASFRHLAAPSLTSFKEIEIVTSSSQSNRRVSLSESTIIPNATHDSPSIDNKMKILMASKEDIRSLKRKVLSDANDSERGIVLQIQQVSKQNSAKAFLKAYKKFALSQNQCLYTYDINQNQYQYKLCSDMPLVCITNPTKKQLEAFARKFKKFFTGKQYNNTTLKTVIRNRLYGKLFEDFLQNHASEWLQLSKTKNKEDLSVLISYLQLCTRNHDYLIFLRDHDKSKQLREFDQVSTPDF